MGEIGKVVADENGLLKVSMIRQEACAKCRACIAGMSEKEMFIYAKNSCCAEIGDSVNIELESKKFLKATLIMYGVPLVFLLISFFIGTYTTNYFELDNGEILSFIFGIIIMIFSYKLISLNEEKFEKSDYKPVATKIVN